MTSWLVGALTLAGVLLLPRPRADRRLRAVLPGGRAGRAAPGAPSAAVGRADAEGTGRPPPGPAVLHAAALVGGAGVAVLLGGAAGALAGVVVAVAAWHLLPRLSSAPEHRRRLVAELPLVADLLAAAVSAGLDVAAAAAAVAAALDGPWAAALSRAVALHRLGASPAQAWARLALLESGDAASPVGPAAAGDDHGGGGSDPRPAQVAAFARAIARAVDGGSPLADSLARLAVDVRAEQRAGAQEAAARAGVRMVGPLVACALPAFVLIGVVPAVAGLAAGALGQLR